MEFLREEDELSRYSRNYRILKSYLNRLNFFSVQTSGNNLTQLEKKFGGSKEADWDSGFSDG